MKRTPTSRDISALEKSIEGMTAAAIALHRLEQALDTLGVKFTEGRRLTAPILELITRGVDCDTATTTNIA